MTIATHRMLPPCRFAAAALALLVSSPVALLAQDGLSELDKLRVSYNTKLAETLRATVSEHHKALSDLERERAAVGDYVTAHAAHARAAQLTIQFADLTAGPAAGFTLDAARANTSGNVSLDRSAGVLKRFGSVGSRATWEPRQSLPGNYDVYLTYATAPTVDNPAYTSDSGLPRKLVAGGSISIREATARAGDDTPPLTVELSATGSWDTFETIKLGTLELRSAATSIELAATDVKPEGLMVLKELRFQRLPPPPSVSGSPPDSLRQLQGRHSTNLTGAVKPVTDAHIAALEALAKSTAASGDLDAVVAVREQIEIARNQGAGIPTDAGSVLPDAITLKAIDPLRVKTTGEINASSKGHLTKLAPTGATVQWDLQHLKLPPGFYEIGLRARSTDRSGGTFNVTAGASSFSSSMRRDENYNPSTSTFRDRPAGILFLTDNVSSLTLTVGELLPGGDQLFDLESLTLRLTDRNAFEQAKAEEQSGGGASQWIKLEGAKLRSSSNAPAADNFAVTHDGKTFHVRLYGVDCPPADFRDGSFLEREMNRYSLDEKQVKKVGKDGFRLMRRALSAGPFVIYTKNEDASITGTKRTYAFVLTQEGLLSHQLILAGLALPKAPFSDAPAEINPGVTAALHEMWIKGEVDKARKAKRGIWEYRQ